MQLIKMLKVAAIVTPVLFLNGCLWGSAEDEANTETTNIEQQESASVTSITGEDVDSTALTSGFDNDDGFLSESEKMEQMRAEQKTIFFAFDNSGISGDYAEMLAAHAAYLRDNPVVTVVVEGHTDERGTPEYNIALGERRARAVAQYLQNLGVSSEQISIISYGEEKPLVYGQSEMDYAKNRRAVLVY